MLIKASFIYSAISCLSVILSVICYITFNISGIYEIKFKDGYKGPGNNVHLDPYGVGSKIEFVKIKDTSGKWVDLSVCHLINVTAGYKESKLWWDVRWWSLQSTSY